MTVIDDTSFEFMTDEGWLPIGQLSVLADPEAEQAPLLKGILDFFELKESESVPNEGFLLPETRGICLGRVVDIAFLPELPTEGAPQIQDGLFLCKPAA